MKNKATVFHHSADYDGIFCREIARKFLPEAKLVGWNFPDKPMTIPPEGDIYVLDLPVDRLFGDLFSGGQHTKFFCTPEMLERVIWIDHHKSSIESHPTSIRGFRIDGVSACRLAWQWFTGPATHKFMPDAVTKQDFLDRKVDEPIAVMLAGEYDVWDHEKSDGDDIAFQFGLDAQSRIEWHWLLQTFGDSNENDPHISGIISDGKAAMRCYAKRDSDIMETRSFLAKFHGMTFLCLNTTRCNLNTFAAKDNPNTGHVALLAFYFNGKDFNFSLYHASHRKDLDLSEIAKKYGGGGHRGACGFRSNELPDEFVPL